MHHDHAELFITNRRQNIEDCMVIKLIISQVIHGGISIKFLFLYKKKKQFQVLKQHSINFETHNLQREDTIYIIERDESEVRSFQLTIS